MNPFVLFFTFMFLFSTSWGIYTEDEIKKMWADTNYSFDILFYTLDANLCYKSKKKFSSCMMAFNDLLLKIKKEGEDDKFHQLRVSDTGELEIASITEEDFPKTEEDLLVSIRERREAFRLFYRKIMTSKSETDSPLSILPSVSLVTLPNPHFPNPSVSYKRHQPEKTLLYKLIQENLLDFYQQMDRDYENGLPEFVKKEFDEFLKCGVLAHGFPRVQCTSCKHEKLVAFSCKRRGFCPSCGARRMAENAIHLIDEVFPKKPMRQWVLTFPFELRFLFAREPKIMGEVLSLVNRTLSTFLVKKAGLTRKSGARTGSVTFIQHFGGSLNLNIHFHMMFPDGVYSFENGRSKFHFTTPPSNQELDKLLTSLVQRVVRFLERRGLIQRDEDQAFLSINSAPSAMDQVQSSSITYRIALGKNKGQKALTLKTLSETNHREKPFLSKHSGFSLHAGVSTKAHQREKPERICRYISRPGLSEQRLSLNSQGKVIYQLKTPYENGTTRIVLDPLDFLSRLASLIPKPRTNLIRFHGVFAPNFKYRHLITPKTKNLGKQTTQPGNSSSMTWARRLKRVFGMDIEVCPECGGKLKVISSILMINTFINFILALIN